MIELGDAERLVYRELLKTPGAAFPQLVQRLQIDHDQARSALDNLLSVKLATADEQGGLHAVPPQLGYAGLIGEVERDAQDRLRAADLARGQITEMAFEYAEFRSHEAIIELTSLDAVRMRLVDLSQQAKVSCDALAPQRNVSTDTIEASRPLNNQALERGVVMRCIYPDSLRNEPGTLEYARWLADHGSGLRTTPVVPLQMVLIDSEVALIPIDPDEPQLGALEVHSPGVVTALTALFDITWERSTELDAAPVPNSRGLTPQEAEVLRLLGSGHTDESAARRLQISVRTLRRLIADLTDRLEAHSRFEAGVKAANRGWI
ncbi:helix-turn-helix transcriptional regulator [Naumannella halotolerans]|uniref:Regulatory LuxR family protein n=1 Tax=Naumannella halotolerans TaxID=993414 RepID=A0A4R7J9H4_9ACTN|nr:LuxR C-terminal-related transcriptional regulator [Naumannella halotolerans]TDT34182.1 regulatory LuxR family protein [Naumannella halotolerans]